MPFCLCSASTLHLMTVATEVNGTKGGDSKQAVLAAAELTNGKVIPKFAGAN